MNELKSLKITNIIVLILTLFCIFIIFYVDSTRFATLNPGVEPIYWFLDHDLDLPLSIKGKLMITCMVICLPVLFGYLYNSFKLKQIRQNKEEKYISSLILFASVYFLLARLVEFLYIPSDSDFYGIHYLGQFHISFDAVGMSLFLVFSVRVFLAEYVERNNKLLRLVLFLGFGTLAVVIFVILSYLFIEDVVYAITLIIGISLILLVSIMGIAIIVSLKIFSLRNRVEERKKELLLIAVSLILAVFIGFMILATIITFYILDLPEISYVFRMMKLIAHIGLFCLIYISLIRPAFQK